MANMMEITQPTLPVFDGDLNAAIEAWLAAQKLLADDREKLKEMLLALKTMKNPMFGIQMIMMQMMNTTGDSIGVFGATMEINKDLQQYLTQAQEGFSNGMAWLINDKDNSPIPPSVQKEIEDMIKNIDKLEDFLKFEENDPNSPIAKGDIEEMLKAVDGFKQQFGKDWGNVGLMAATMATWAADAAKGTTDPGYKNIQDNLQILNGSLTVQAATLNTEVQFTSQVFNQEQGIDENTIQSQLKLFDNMVHNQVAG